MRRIIFAAALALCAAAAFGQQATRVMVAPFEDKNSGLEQGEIDKLYDKMVQGFIDEHVGVVIRDTADLDRIRKEYDMQKSPWFDSGQTTALGKALGATHIVSVSVTRADSLDALYTLTAWISNTEKLTVDSSESLGPDTFFRLENGMKRFVSELIRKMPSSGQGTGDSDGFEEQKPVSPPDPPDQVSASDTESGGLDDSRRLWSIGVAVGTAFGSPRLTVTPQVVWSWKYLCLDAGLEIGLFSAYEDEIEGLAYWSLYSFAHVNRFMPIGNGGNGFFVGGGVGWMQEVWNHESSGTAIILFPALDAQGGGIFCWRQFKFNLTLSGRFAWQSSSTSTHQVKLAVGFTYRFNAIRGTG